MTLSSRILLSLCLTLMTFANTDTRSWKLRDGSTIRAELVSYDQETENVILLQNDTHELQVPFDRFSEIDKAWVIEWTEFAQVITKLNQRLGGTLDHLVVEGSYQTDLHLYYPSSYQSENAKSYPVMILFNAGAKAMRYLQRHMEAAEQSGMILISCGQFRNTGDNEAKEEAFLARFREVFLAIQENIVYDPESVFMGGNSGGAWRAYHYSAWVDYPWAGIYANGGWLGGQKYFQEDYADHMRVVMVNGNNDKAANQWIEADSKVLNQHEAEIALIAFEGGHQIPPVRSQLKAFNWLINRTEFDER